MPDIDRRPNDRTSTTMHTHRCPNCNRPWSCSCHKQEERSELVCRDCETGTYNPVIHGGTGERAEA